jgi:mannosyltransferase
MLPWPPVTSVHDGGTFPADLRSSPTRVAIAVIGIVAIVAGIVLRFIADTPLWLDEAQSLAIADMALGDIPDALRLDGHPPLYYFMIHIWMEIAGDSDFAVRSFSGIIAVASLPLVWVAGRRLAGLQAGWLALTAAAVSPFAIRYATEARMYSLVALLGLALWYLTDRALTSPKWWRLASIAIVAALALYTHYWSAYLIGALGLVALWAWWRHRNKAGPKIAIALTVGILCFLPWTPIMLDQLAHTGTPWALPSAPTRLFAETIITFGGSSAHGESIVLAVGLTLLFAVGALVSSEPRGDILMWRGEPFMRQPVSVVLITLGAGSVVSYLLSAAFQARYAAVVALLFSALVGVGLAKIGDLPVRVLAVFLVVGLGLTTGLRVANTDRSQADEIAAALEERAEPGDMVFFCPDQLGPASVRAMPDDLDGLSYPLLTDAALVDWRDYQERHDAANPIEFAAEIHEMTLNQNLWIVWLNGYRTLGTHCGDIVLTLEELRSGEAVIEPREGVFQPSFLHLFDPVS